VTVMFTTVRDCRRAQYVGSGTFHRWNCVLVHLSLPELDTWAANHLANGNLLALGSRFPACLSFYPIPDSCLLECSGVGRAVGEVETRCGADNDAPWHCGDLVRLPTSTDRYL